MDSLFSRLCTEKLTTAIAVETQSFLEPLVIGFIILPKSFSGSDQTMQSHYRISTMCIPLK